MSPSISAVLPTPDRAIGAGIMLLLAFAAAQTQWGQYKAPVWGQAVPPAWGQYNGTVSANGWRYNRSLQSNEPEGAILNPNQLGASGGKTPGIFTSPDTRLLGRNAP